MGLAKLPMGLYSQLYHVMVKTCHVLFNPLKQIKAGSGTLTCQDTRKIESQALLGLFLLLQLPQKTWTKILGNCGRKTSSICSALFAFEMLVVSGHVGYGHLVASVLPPCLGIGTFPRLGIQVSVVQLPVSGTLPPHIPHTLSPHLGVFLF